MKRFPASILWVLLVAGCHAPMPSLDVLAPYGSSRVPPPGTGSIGTPDSYYTSPGVQTSPTAAPRPAVGNGVRAEWKQPAGSGNLALQDSRQRSPTSGVQHASFETSTGSLPDQSVLKNQRRVRVASGASDASQRQRLSTNPVGTSLRTPPPAEFNVPADAVELSDLPPVVRSRSITSQSLPNQLRGSTEGRKNVLTTGGSWHSRSLP